MQVGGNVRRLSQDQQVLMIDKKKIGEPTEYGRLKVEDDCQFLKTADRRGRHHTFASLEDASNDDRIERDTIPGLTQILQDHIAGCGNHTLVSRFESKVEKIIVITAVEILTCIRRNLLGLLLSWRHSEGGRCADSCTSEVEGNAKKGEAENRRKGK
jgi:hypothetical protein